MTSKFYPTLKKIVNNYQNNVQTTKKLFYYLENRENYEKTISFLENLHEDQ